MSEYNLFVYRRPSAKRQADFIGISNRPVFSRLLEQENYDLVKYMGTCVPKTGVKGKDR